MCWHGSMRSGKQVGQGHPRKCRDEVARLSVASGRFRHFLADVTVDSSGSTPPRSLAEGRDTMTATELIAAAQGVVGEFFLSNEYVRAGNVAAALLSKKGNVYTGICIDVACGIGFCAEHAAIAELLKNRETEIEMIVAVSAAAVLPPCGRCRELMFQIDHGNVDAKVVLRD